MQQNKSSKKSIIIIVVVLVLAGIAYFYFSGNPSNSSSASLSSTNPNSSSPDSTGGPIAGTDVLILLGQINSIHIDDTFFQSPVYNSLVDHTVVVPEQNVGRENPFVPVPGAFVSATPPATTKTTTVKH